MQNVPNVGRLATPAARRDAIHVAVAPAIAAERLAPGQHVSLGSDGQAIGSGDLVGIVDPFLATSVESGQTFWLFLYPNTVTSLRHEWTHPAFPADRTISDHEMWLRVYAVKMNCYDEPEEAFRRLIESLKSRKLLAHGSDLHGLYELHEADELRYHAEQYLGEKINWSTFTFSCSC